MTKAYKIQISDKMLSISRRENDTNMYVQDDTIILSLPKLLEALKECGYQITEPPSKAFTELKEFLDNHDCFSQVDSVGNTIFVYIHNIADRKLWIKNKRE